MLRSALLCLIYTNEQIKKSNQSPSLYITVRFYHINVKSAQTVFFLVLFTQHIIFILRPENVSTHFVKCKSPLEIDTHGMKHRDDSLDTFKSFMYLRATCIYNTSLNITVNVVEGYKI